MRCPPANRGGRYIGKGKNEHTFRRQRTDFHAGPEDLLGGGVCGAAGALPSFRKLVFTENRNSDEKVMLLLFLMPPLAIGVMLRLFGGYQFFDLSLEGSFLMGLLGGRIVGLLGGSLISLPAVRVSTNGWRRPMAALVGLFAGQIRDVIPEKEDIWHFGPFQFLNIPHVALEAGPLSQRELGHAAALRLRRMRSRLDRTRDPRAQSALALLDSIRTIGDTWRWWCFRR